MVASMVVGRYGDSNDGSDDTAVTAQMDAVGDECGSDDWWWIDRGFKSRTGE